MIELRNSRVLRTIPLMLIAVLFCPLTYGKVIYVDDDAMGTNDGTSWADAYNYLQNALADASRWKSTWLKGSTNPIAEQDSHLGTEGRHSISSMA